MPLSHHISTRLAAERQRELNGSATAPARHAGSPPRGRVLVVLTRRPSPGRLVLRRSPRRSAA